METGEQAQLVEAGSFRVDRAKALEKLSAFHLEDPALFILSWVRTAVSGGASDISVDYDGRLLEIRFNGEPFEKADFRDPYGGLFAEEGESALRLKHMAFGILGALHLSASEIRIVSGGSGRRYRLVVSSLSRERVDLLESVTEPAPASVRIVWPRGEAPESMQTALQTLFSKCGTVAGSLTVNGRLVPSGQKRVSSFDGEPGRIRFDEDGLRGWLDCGVPGAGSVAWHHAGVFVSEEVLAGTLMGVCGVVDGRDLNLTASLSGPVRDAAYDDVRLAVARMGRRLLLKCAGERARMLLRQMGLGRKEKWRVRFGRHTHWILGQCAAQLKGSRPDSKDPLKRALWRVPLLSDMRTGGPLSLEDLFRVREDTGSILLSDRRIFRTIDQEWEIIWVPDERAFAALETLFGSAVRRQRVP